MQGLFKRVAVGLAVSGAAAAACAQGASTSTPVPTQGQGQLPSAPISVQAQAQAPQAPELAPQVAPIAPIAVPVRQLPVWEAGAGVGTFTVPDYRGSDERRGYVLPFPYLIYRGDWLKVDREGLRAKLFDDKRVDIELSGAATFALRADQNTARQGMKPLRTIVEIGPEFVYHLVDGRTSPVGIDLRLSTRAPFALEGGSSIKYLGWTASPSIRFLVGNVANTGFDGVLSLGALFSSRDYNAYYYSVDSQYATASRPAYQAAGGFGGLQMIAGSSRRIGDFWVGGYVRYDSLSGATFENSPLVKTRGYFTAGIAVAYVFGKSQQTVNRSTTGSY